MVLFRGVLLACLAYAVSGNQVACIENYAGGGSGEIYCDQLPTSDGQGCDSLTWEYWDCAQCHDCPQGWIPDVTTTTTMNPQCIYTSCKDSWAAALESCPGDMVKHGTEDCGEPECVGAGWFQFCFPMEQKSKCCPPAEDQDCDWWDITCWDWWGGGGGGDGGDGDEGNSSGNWSNATDGWMGWDFFGGLFQLFTDFLGDLWAELDPQTQQIFSDASTIGQANEAQVHEVGPQLLSGLKTVRGFKTKQIKWSATDMQQMTADQLSTYLGNINSAKFVNALSKIQSLQWTVVQAELIVERLSATDLWGSFDTWSKLKFGKLGKLINQVDPEFLAQFKDGVIAGASNTPQLSQATLTGMWEQFKVMKMGTFKMIIKRVRCERLYGAFQQWEADKTNYGKNKKDKKKKKKAIKKKTKKCDRRLQQYLEIV